MSHGTWSRAAWPLVVSLVVLLAFVLGRPAGAQSGGPARRWEHRVFAMNPADYADTLDYKAILEQAGNDTLRAEAPFMQHVLEHLGAEGWELVQVDRVRPNMVHLFLKRPAQ